MRASLANRMTKVLVPSVAAVMGMAVGAWAQTQSHPQGNAVKSAAPVTKRLCKLRLEASAGGASRGEAQRKAIESWATAAAAAHGDAFTKWAIAGIARTSCSLTPEGHRCRAAASPCRDLIDAPAAKR